jgi:hypothetical protein
MLYCPDCGVMTPYHTSIVEGRRERSLDNVLTPFSRIKATVLFSLLLTISLGIIAGIVLKAFGELPSEVVIVGSSVGALLTLISGALGINLLEGSFGVRIRTIWQNAHRLLAALVSFLIVALLTLLAVLIPMVGSDPYTHGLSYGSSKLVYENSLHDNSLHEWDTESPYVTFADGVYQIISDKSNQSIDGMKIAGLFSNFVLEAEMTVKRGDCGGIVFRQDLGHSQEYLFEACQDGNYQLIRYYSGYPYANFMPGKMPNQESNTVAERLAWGINTSIIHTGLNHANLIAVVASANYIELWVNHQNLYKVLESADKEGAIGLVSYDFEHPTTVAFRNIKIWELAD